ncbi:hypothetical protein L1887_30188 [Cichorium endivia]|nr:hypothetical protein L1887_30188 [Cichorium endivia]
MLLPPSPLYPLLITAPSKLQLLVRLIREDDETCILAARLPPPPLPLLPIPHRLLLQLLRHRLLLAPLSTAALAIAGQIF